MSTTRPAGAGRRISSGAAGSRAAVAVFEEERHGAVRRVQHFLHPYPTTVPFLVLVASRVDPQLDRRARQVLSPFNLSLILQQVTIIAMLGTAQTLVILTAGIDLSVGVIMILCSVVMGRTASSTACRCDRLSARACSSVSPAAPSTA